LSGTKNWASCVQEAAVLVAWAQTGRYPGAEGHRGRRSRLQVSLLQAGDGPRVLTEFWAVQLLSGSQNEVFRKNRNRISWSVVLGMITGEDGKKHTSVFTALHSAP
jgi:hypothetical protein